MHVSAILGIRKSVDSSHVDPKESKSPSRFNVNSGRDHFVIEAEIFSVWSPSFYLFGVFVISPPTYEK